MISPHRSLASTALVLLLLAGACASDSSPEASPEAASPTAEREPTATETPTPEPVPTATETPTPSPEPEPVQATETLDTRALVETLASDELEGRDNGTPASLAAQELLIGQVSQFADPAFPNQEGLAGFLQPFEDGTNILALIPGGDLADELVIIGAHYDHLGVGDCRGVTADDDICNGATDNATGVAAAMSIARTIAEADAPPRRTVLIAFWDREEDGLEGAAHYVTDPLVSLDQTVAYVNFDIQGANLLPSLRNATIAVGAETGGPTLISAATEAAAASALDTFALSLLYGQGRSDHAILVAAGVPSVFFTDANSGCYHTVKDDLDAVDFDKLDQQINTALALSQDLVATDTPPVFDAAPPLTTFDDAVALLAMVDLAAPDLDLFDPDTRTQTETFTTDLRLVVEAGPDAFDGAATGLLLGGAGDFVSALAELECDAYLG